MSTFNYYYRNNYIGNLPFRRGDVVTVKDWGCCYTTYRRAFRFFTKKIDTPYYHIFFRREKNKEFKVVDVALHENGYDIVVYIKDRDFKDAIISAEGLNLIKQYPLRKREKQDVKLKIIK